MSIRFFRASLCAAAVVCGFAAMPALAGGKVKPAKSLSSADKDFLSRAVLECMAEVDLGKLAVQNGASAEVKQLGQKMADDHSKAEDDLKKLAANKNYELPTFLGPAGQIDRMELQKLTGDKFDREYIDDTLKDHKKDLSTFEREAEKGKDPDVKALASKMLPRLKQHLDLAEQAEAKVDKGS
ncbi:MAG TPA: DUF4142 domain-containing protein [Bryobacteraceae bacterium]|nr:DUF4142 domain-containing protein [Bryobacteraceae bacterium]